MGDTPQTVMTTKAPAVLIKEIKTPKNQISRRNSVFSKMYGQTAIEPTTISSSNA